MKSYNYFLTFLLLASFFFSVNNYPQESKLKKVENKQSVLEKYSAFLVEKNEIKSLRSSTAQHFKVNENLYIAFLYSGPAYFDRENNMLVKIDIDTTIVAPASGRVFKDGVNLTKYDNTLRIQNTDNNGCENGFRSWVKFDISSLSDSTNVVWIEQHIYCTELHEGIFDYLNYDIHRVDNYPDTAAPFALWTDIYDGSVYEAGEWVSNPPDWEWCLLDPPAASDFTNAIHTTNWFGLGYMVKCDEDDGDYYAVFMGAQDNLPPYLVIGYNFITDVKEVSNKVSSYQLYQNYPNPFNPTTVIRYELPSSSYVELRVFDVLGRDVATLANGVQSTGIHEVEFNASGLPGGFYFYSLQTKEYTKTKKMILLK